MDNSFSKAFQICNSIAAEISKVIVGKPQAVKMLMIALISGGHVLIEDVPGVGKTTIASALAKATGLDFKRVQLTPDVMASDITGYSIFDKSKGAFVFQPGVVMTNVLIADEINRTSPKTQSALLEAMEEKQATVDGTTRTLADPFMVIATENPLGFVGTYPLPEAQLDRFLLKFVIGYPSFQDEMKIVSDRKKGNPMNSIVPVASAEDIRLVKNQVENIYIDNELYKYIVALVNATRSNKNISLAASPRASLALAKASAANALLCGRNYVTPTDVQYMLEFVVAHRIMLSAEAKLDGLTNEAVVESIKKSIKAPVLKTNN